MRVYSNEKNPYTKPQKKCVRRGVSYEEFKALLRAIPLKSKYAVARSQIAFILLYFTGLRLSRLLELKYAHYKDIKEKGKLNLNFYTKKNSIQEEIWSDGVFEDIFIKQKECFDINLDIGEEVKEMLLKYEEEGRFITHGKKLNEPLFTSHILPRVPISREFFDNQLNKICKQVSNEITTHSFRIAFIQKHLEKKSIEEVQRLVAHTDIKATAVYKNTSIGV